MKILDAKGKLFGKINLVDCVVLVVILAIVIAAAFKLTGSSVSDALNTGTDAVTIRYEVLCTQVNPTTCDYAVTQIGAQLMNSGEMIDATITDCVIEPHTDTVEAADGTLHYVENTTVHDLRFTIEADVQFVANAYSVGTQELRVGKSHIVKTVGLEVSGTILSMEEVSANADE